MRADLLKSISDSPERRAARRERIPAHKKGGLHMAVFRVERNANYTVMCNHHLRDKGLSLKAKGLLSQMLSLPEEWDYTLSGLAAINKASKDAIRTAVQELGSAGYIIRRQTQDDTGKFASNEYIIHEQPVQEQSAPPLLDFPTTENPSLEKPSSENPTTVIYKGELKKDLIPPKAPQGGRHKREKSKPDWKPERLARLWDFYRTRCRGESKQAAVRAWDKLKPDDDLIAVMGRALERQLQSQEWQAGIGIPYASTWINNRRWEDEPKTSGSSQPPVKEGWD